MNIRHYLIGGIALVAIVATLVYVLSPATITGDREADAACLALATHLGGIGTGSDEEVAQRLAGTDNRTDAMVADVISHTAQSSIDGINAAGQRLQDAANESGLFRGLSIIVATAGMATACQSAGWTAQKAGYVPEGGR